jgi:hypothetical protein
VSVRVHPGYLVDDWPSSYTLDDKVGAGVVAKQGNNETVEELLDLARANAQALIIATTGFLAQAGIPLEGWSGYLGQVFANSWDESMSGEPKAFLDAVLTNYKALGAQVLSTKTEDGRAEAVISGFPSEDLCRELDADCSLAEAYNDAAAHVAERLGLTWWWGSSGDTTTLVVTTGA